MPIMQGLEWTFDTVADTYGKMRPGYVDALYEMLFAYQPEGEDSCVAEVGSGAGQATEALLRTGCALTAVEYGPQFSSLLKEKFRQYPKFSVITAKFEDMFFEDNAFDLVFSASAFHWVPEKIGYEKVRSMLKPGGAFARFANHPYRAWGNPALGERIDDLYAAFYNPFHNRQRTVIREYSEEEAASLASVAEQYGFRDIRYALFYRERIFSSREYIALLGTYSDHIVLPEQLRSEFFAQIEEAIEANGGSITVRDTIDLQLARK